MNNIYDQRVKKLMQAELLWKLCVKTVGLLVLALVFSLLFSGLTKAQSSIPDLYLVPKVVMTPIGAAVYQPQTGAGYEFLTSSNLNTFNTSTLESGTSYRPPKYDAFATGTADMKVEIPETVISTAQNVDFTVRNNMPGSIDGSAGTTNTTFTFMAAVTSSTSLVGGTYGEFQYRWDFKNDGKDVTYFSRVPTVYHQYKEAGIFTVKLEVLDKAGHISQVAKKVTVVKNDAPQAIFTVNKASAPVNSIFTFDTSLSSDNQYNRYNMFYRFDWDSDGQWDTTYQNKTTWNHIFREVGHYKITMEAVDPERATSKSALEVDVVGDEPPKAGLTIGKVGESGFGTLVYNFDASTSTDDHTILNKLRFRWDFNYNGKEDIVFDTSWSNSPKYSGSYKIGGNKVIRLQVMDEQGQIDETFAKITVPWPQELLNKAVDAVTK